MKKIGITGGIGSGKSLVCRLFALYGIPVYHADNAARRLMEENNSLKTRLVHHFGNIYNDNGDLMSSALATLVFNDQEALNALNSIVHPFVSNDYMEWEMLQKAPFVLREAAILFESGTHTGLDYVVTVAAPENIRIARTINRDNRSKEQVMAIINKQSTDGEKISKSDFVIINDDVLAVMPQVWNLYGIFSNGK